MQLINKPTLLLLALTISAGCVLAQKREPGSGLLGGGFLGFGWGNASQSPGSGLLGGLFGQSPGSGPLDGLWNASQQIVEGIPERGGILLDGLLGDRWGNASQQNGSILLEGLFGGNASHLNGSILLEGLFGGNASHLNGSSLLDGLWDRLGNASHFIVDGIGNASHLLVDGVIGAGKNGSAIAEGLLDSLRNTTSQFALDAAAFGEQIAQALHRAAAEALARFSSSLRATLQNLRGVIGRVSDRVKRNALQEALKGLERVTAGAEALEDSLAAINKQLEEQRQKYAGEIKEQWNDWAAAQLERVDEQTNGAGSDEAEAIIDELQNRYTAYLHSCLEELQVRQGQYEQKVHETVFQFHNATNALSRQINVCLRRTSGRISCHRGINNALDQLRDAPDALLGLKQQGLQLLAVGLDASSCVGQTVAEYALEKPNVELQLTVIIKRHQQGSATDGESSSGEDGSDGESAT